VSAAEGRIPFRGYETWYRVVGGGEADGKLPVLLLHGGPGGTHDYLEPLEALSATGRRAVLYDQIGCGRSDLPPDASFYTVELFVDEVGAVRRALGLDRVHLFGSSWGGMLAMEYALTAPTGLASLVLASSPASIPQWVQETARLRAELPSEVQETLRRHEEAGTTDESEYHEACNVFYERHVCRAVPWPDCVRRSFDFITTDGLVYRTMNGPSEFHVTGTLRDWDVVDRLGTIDVPTLVVTGEHDEATPAINRTVSDAIPGAESVVYPGASHMAHVEDAEGYVVLLDGFFSRVEALSGGVG
jgi:L-proline amide hydrolase